MIIAVDGPAGAGKSSVTRAVASALSFQYVDTGAIYRTVAYLAKREGIAWDNPVGLTSLSERLLLSFAMVDGVNRVSASLGNGEFEDVTTQIRTPEVSLGSSKVSAHPSVRDALFALQRRLGLRADSLLEGRDIGTVVFPEADVKVFLTADPAARAKRRYHQLLDASSGPGDVPAYEDILAEIVARDARDSERVVAPLKPAEDAIILDSTAMSLDEVVAKILELVEAARVGRGHGGEEAS